MPADKSKPATCGLAANIHRGAADIEDHGRLCCKLVEKFQYGPHGCCQNHKVRRPAFSRMDSADRLGALQNVRRIDAMDANSRHSLLERQAERSAQEARSVNRYRVWKAIAGHDCSIRRHSSMTRSKMRRMPSASRGPVFSRRMVSMICRSRSGSKTFMFLS